MKVPYFLSDKSEDPTILYRKYFGYPSAIGSSLVVGGNKESIQLSSHEIADRVRSLPFLEDNVLHNVSAIYDEIVEINRYLLINSDESFFSINNETIVIMNIMLYSELLRRISIPEIGQVDVNKFEDLLVELSEVKPELYVMMTSGKVLDHVVKWGNGESKGLIFKKTFDLDVYKKGLDNLSRDNLFYLTLSFLSVKDFYYDLKEYKTLFEEDVLREAIVSLLCFKSESVISQTSYYKVPNIEEYMDEAIKRMSVDQVGRVLAPYSTLLPSQHLAVKEMGVFLEKKKDAYLDLLSKEGTDLSKLKDDISFINYMLGLKEKPSDDMGYLLSDQFFEVNRMENIERIRNDFRAVEDYVAIKSANYVNQKNIGKRKLKI